MKKKELKKKRLKIDYSWIIKIILISFLISIIFSFISETSIPNVNIVIGIIIVFVFILIGVLFDMIGIAIATANEAKFHSMATKKVKGAKIAIKLKKNADKVSSFCNDVIGDICGIMSGSAGAVIALKISEKLNCNSTIIALLVVGLTSALTIGGKAMEKGYAMSKSDDILYKCAKILSIFKKD